MKGKGLAEDRDPEEAEPLPGAIKVRSRGQVTVRDPDLRAARCPSREGCRNGDSIKKAEAPYRRNGLFCKSGLELFSRLVTKPNLLNSRIYGVS